MHKYYAARLFDKLDEVDVLAKYAPRGIDGNPENVKTCAGLVAAGFDVNYVGPEGGTEGEVPGVDGEGEVGGEEDKGDIAVDEALFNRWLELSQLPLGTVEQKWWSELEPSPEGGLAGLRQDWDACPAELLSRIRAELASENKVDGDGVPLRALVPWLREHVGEGFNVEGEADDEALLDQMLLEFEVVGDLGAGALESTGGMEAPAGGEAPEREGFDIARGMVHGWPSVAKDPTGAKQAGRFVKAFPLKLSLIHI